MTGIPGDPFSDNDAMERVMTQAGATTASVEVLATPVKRKLIQVMADRWGMDADKFSAAIAKVAMPAGFSNEEFASCLMVANKYDLDPLTKQIYFMKTRGGGIQPIVSVDGWAHISNRHPAHDGMSFVDHVDDKGKLISITCRIHRKDRTHPIEVTEYMAECAGASPAWKQTPARMLRHRAMMQCARYAYGIAGVMDRDEFDQWQDKPTITLVSETDVEQPAAVSAYAAKKNGAGSLCNEIILQLGSAASIDVLDHLIEIHADAMASMPRSWRELIQGEYETRSAQLKQSPGETA
jgi:phage recombination protein Bet